MAQWNEWCISLKNITEDDRHSLNRPIKLHQQRPSRQWVKGNDRFLVLEKGRLIVLGFISHWVDKTETNKSRGKTMLQFWNFFTGDVRLLTHCWMKEGFLLLPFLRRFGLCIFVGESNFQAANFRIIRTNFRNEN